ncbi:MAG: DNA alkylation repair protein [Clostridiales bacterium]|jgi:3-methyladenine DNA glycosylase AlkD|nr:DNA alkylation repair protein [Clostridiales bacterium]
MKQVEKLLFAKQDEAYGDFEARLIPNINRDTIIGVRVPDIREVAKNIMKTHPAWVPGIFAELPHKYFEESLLHGFLISLMKDYDKAILELDRYLPFIRCWEESDCITPPVFRKHLPELYESGRLQDWMNDANVYTKRFAIIVMMNDYLGDAYSDEIPDQIIFELNKFYRDMHIDADIAPLMGSDDYYLRMAVAWFFATALAKQEKSALPWLENERLDTWTHNKTIQKAIESRRISDEMKDYLRTLKRANQTALRHGGKL